MHIARLKLAVLDNPGGIGIAQRFLDVIEFSLVRLFRLVEPIL